MMHKLLNIFTVLPFFIFGQCHNELSQIVMNMSDTKLLSANEVYEYKLVVNMVPSSNSNQKQTSSSINLMVGKEFNMNSSEYTSLYSDSGQVFSVIKDQKTILWHKIKPKSGIFSPSEIFSKIASSTCTKKVVGNKEYTVMYCLPIKEIMDKEKILKIEYWIDMQTNFIYKSKLIYSAEAGMKYVEILYKSIQKKVCPEGLSSGLNFYFFGNSSQTLSGRFKGYKLINQTK